jgi:hypothetical protein
MRSLLPVMIVASAAALAWPAHVWPADFKPAAAAPQTGGVGWSTLTTRQRNALRPLASLWPTLRPDQQRQWMTLARNFNRLNPTEQLMLQRRMTRWAELPAAQRAQARLNFGEARRLPADKKRNRWEQYQTLSAEERERLARSRPAPALHPTSGPSARLAPGGIDPATLVNPQTLLPWPSPPPPSQSSASAPRQGS